MKNVAIIAIALLGYVSLLFSLVSACKSVGYYGVSVKGPFHAECFVPLSTPPSL